MNKEELIDKLIDYSKEATKNKYSEYLIKYDLNKIINEYHSSVMDNIYATIDSVVKDNYEDFMGDIVEDIKNYIY